MTPGARVLELRLGRLWLALVAIAVPAFGALAVLATADILARNPNPGLDKILTIVGIDLVLGGLIALPGIAVLARHVRGVPNVRLDGRGITWGSDHDRDLSIEWGDVERVTTKKVKIGRVTDRALIIRTRPGRPHSSAKTLYGRILGLGNWWQYDAALVISTFGGDHTAEEILAFIADHVPPSSFQGLLPVDQYLRG